MKSKKTKKLELFFVIFWYVIWLTILVSVILYFPSAAMDSHSLTPITQRYPHMRCILNIQFPIREFVDAQHIRDIIEWNESDMGVSSYFISVEFARDMKLRSYIIDMSQFHNPQKIRNILWSAGIDCSVDDIQSLIDRAEKRAEARKRTEKLPTLGEVLCALPFIIFYLLLQL